MNVIIITTSFKVKGWRYSAAFFLIVTNTRLQRCLRILKQFMTNALQSLMHIKQSSE